MTVIIREEGIAVFTAPKVACTSIKTALFEVENGFPPFVEGQTYWGLSSGDIDGDGDLDVALANVKTGVEIYLQDKDHRFLKTGSTATAYSLPPEFDTSVNPTTDITTVMTSIKTSSSSSTTPSSTTDTTTRSSVQENVILTTSIPLRDVTLETVRSERNARSSDENAANEDEESTTESTIDLNSKMHTSFYPDYKWYSDPNLDKVRFRTRGEMVGSLSFAHLVLDFNMAGIKTHTKEFCDQIQIVSENSDATADEFVKEVIDGYRSECDKLYRRLESNYELWYNGARVIENSRMTRETHFEYETRPFVHHRPKRQLLILGAFALIAGAIAISSYYFSDKAMVSLSYNSGTSAANIRVLQDHETQISVNTHSIKVLNETVAELCKEQTATDHKLKRVAEIQKVGFQFNALRDTINAVLQGLEHLHNGRLTSSLIDPVKLTSIISSMRVKLASVNLKMILSNVEEVFSSEVSWIIFQNDTIRCLIHLPLYREQGLMSLYEYLPIPYQISPDHLLEIVPDQRMIAVDNRNSKYRQMSALDLTSCTKVKHLYYCKTGNTFYRNSEKTCLFSLYTRNMVDIEEHCPVKIEVNADKLIQMSNKELIIYHHKKQQNH